MAAVPKEKDNEVHVTFEDQQQINKFARHNAKLQDLQDELDTKKKDLQNLEDAADELVILDEEETVPYMVGEIFVSAKPEEAGQLLEAAKERVQKEIKTLDTECGEHKGILSDLKVKLYAKFGNNINLENEEES
ncbi:prefoldin subunit 4-like [Lineus longissimus]|uniref:prefoldin subunit 4-like n=1 Tax=Lineus longissimus TaxID=88925 RepID=UPI00315D09AB